MQRRKHYGRIYEIHPQDQCPELTKWLNNLFLLGIAGAVIAVLAAIPALDNLSRLVYHGWN